MRYPDCQRTDGDCDVCSLSSRNKDCRNNPVNKIAYLRTAAGLTQAQLAEKAGINIMMVSRLERGERLMKNTTLETALKLAEALGVEPKDLI